MACSCRPATPSRSPRRWCGSSATRRAPSLAGAAPSARRAPWTTSRAITWRCTQDDRRSGTIRIAVAVKPRLTQLVKAGLDAARHYRRRLARDAFPGVAVLCYHGVRPRGAPDDGIAFAGLHLPLEEFEAHCRLLAEDCHPISLAAWRDALAGGP